MKKIVFILCIAASFSSFSQATLVADINQGTNSSSPSSKVHFDDAVYFAADDGVNGYELWKSDGTEAGTILFKEFVAGGDDGIAQNFESAIINNTLFFIVANTIVNTSGYELWKTDGTQLGTEKVASLGSIDISTLLIVNNVLIFNKDSELWKSDGTEAGTVKINQTGIFGGRYVVDGTNLYYSGSGAGVGNELWKSDGTVAGTMMIKNINSGASNSYPSNFHFANNTVFFTANDGVNGIELWKTDGTEAGTVIVKDINSGATNTFSFSNPMKVFDNALFFIVSNKLWKSDGTEAGTVEVIDLESYVKGFVILNAKLYIFNGGNSFWVSDGTTAGTAKTEVPVTEFWHNGVAVVIGNELYFQGSDARGYELWKTDGTAVGTVLVKDIHPEFDDNNIEDIIAFNNKIVFTASDGNWYGKEMWISDGTTAGTMMVKDINQTGNRASNAKNFFEFNSQTFFTADNGINGVELWKTDGATTSMVKDINVGRYYSNPREFVEMNGVFYFKAKTSDKGTELWKSDGTEAGTTMVKDINPDTENGMYSIGNIVVLNSKLYFFASEGTNGYELWESDGTEAGTFLVKDINTGAGNSLRNGKITVYDSKLYFNANDNTNGYELWVSDGTEAGTTLFKDIHTSGSGSPDNLIVFDNLLFFSATTAAEGNELWRSDGIEAGTVLARNIKAGTSSSYPSNFVISGAENINKVFTYDTQLLFTATGANGNEIWQIEVESSYYPQPIQGGSGSYANKLTSHDGELFYTAANELWKVNQTASGSSLVKSGDDTKSISGMISFGGELLFGAGNSGSNLELWRSDGTTTGTVLLQDINPSSVQYGNGSQPSNFFVSGTTLYFTADNGTVGKELWKIEQSALGIKGVSKEFLKVAVYPNPTNGIILLKIENQEIQNVKVYSLFGKEVMRISSENNNQIEHINLQNLATGMYLIKIKTATRTFTRKIMKQ